MLTALQELMKPANLIQKSQNIIQRNEIIRAEAPSKPVLQRYISKKWFKWIFYYKIFILLIEEKKAFVHILHISAFVFWTYESTSQFQTFFDSMEDLQ